MNFIKKITTLLIFVILSINFVDVTAIPVNAHNYMLNINYDDCDDEENFDGIDEAWYILNNYYESTHISQEVSTIKYYFEETYTEGGVTYTWTPNNLSQSVANEIKTAYANSMKKWNNVYFYSYDADGHVVKNKIINIVEGTESDHNLVIYPFYKENSFAATDIVEEDGLVSTIESGTITHYHASKWYMLVCVNSFYVNGNLTTDYVDVLRARTGAHEIGHMLGLYDIDKYGSAGNAIDHHHEILMGYGTPVETRAIDITYKDIAGVAITRGFHTDADHKWLNCGVQTNGKYKLLCSICNGYIEVSNLSGYSCNAYFECSGDHSLPSENMMATASYGNKDYYKCKYCRYVTPFSSIITQNYSTEYYSDSMHKKTNTVLGLAYSFLEEHDITSNGCYACGYLHTHSYSAFLYYNNISHQSRCSCGSIKEEGHYIRRSTIVDNRYAVCLGCEYMLDLEEDIAQFIMTNNTKMTVNGSFILPSGVVVLVDEDVEAFMNGILRFYCIDDIPKIE